MEKRVDVAIIGAGTAGINAMTEVREVTDNFVLINGGILGTTCARVGCMPSKIVIQIADDFHRRHVFDREGIRQNSDLRVELEQALTHVKTLRDEFVNGIIEDVIIPLGDNFIEGYAELISPNLLKVDHVNIRADKIIIATGSRPVIPDQWRHLSDHILTTDTVFEQTRLPDAMAVIGLGAVGLELGQALGRLGVDISGFDVLRHIGGLQDPEVNRHAIEIFDTEFPLYLGAEVDIEKQGDRIAVIAGERRIVVDKLLLSVGRIPNVDGLHLERLGIELDDQGIPRFDPATMQIEDLPIFIAGDVNAYRPILHEVAHEGKAAGYNAVHEPVVAFRRKTPLVVCFTHPSICRAGLTWNDVGNSGPAIGTARFKGGRATIMLRDHGIIRIYADRNSGKLLGTEMAAPDGEHLAHLLAWSIQQGLTVFDLLAMPVYHPTIEETLRAALLDLVDELECKKPRLLGFEVRKK